jgi:hypothetical protein
MILVKTDCSQDQSNRMISMDDMLQNTIENETKEYEIKKMTIK